MSGLYHRHLLKLSDFTSAEFNSLLQLVVELEADKKSDKEEAEPAGKDIALIFEKDSTRTRCSPEATAYDQGACATYLGPNDGQIDHKESVKDTTRVLGRMYGNTQYRGYGQEIVETLAEYANMPIWNGLTSEFHPTQLLADLPIMQEHLPGRVFDETTLVYVGDARNNMDNSVLEVAALTDLDLRLIVPQACWPEAALVTEYRTLAQQNSGDITLIEDAAKGVEGVDSIYTGVWVSTKEVEEKWMERIALLRGYQVNSRMMQLTDNPEVKSLHCLPAFHGDQMTLGKRITEEFDLHGGMKVTDEISESAAGIAFDQAENRIHTVKAVMVVTLNK